MSKRYVPRNATYKVSDLPTYEQEQGERYKHPYSDPELAQALDEAGVQPDDRIIEQMVRTAMREDAHELRERNRRLRIVAIGLAAVATLLLLAVFLRWGI
jgi:hypothetical protein